MMKVYEIVPRAKSSAVIESSNCYGQMQFSVDYGALTELTITQLRRSNAFDWAGSRECPMFKGKINGQRFSAKVHPGSISIDTPAATRDATIAAIEDLMLSARLEITPTELQRRNVRLYARTE